MTRLNLFRSDLVSTSVIAVMSLAFAAAISAQCEGTYFKTTKRTITDSQTYVYNFEVEPRARDLTGDGKIDLVAANVNSATNLNRLMIYAGDGAGGFTAWSSITLSGVLLSEQSYYLEDYNGDGKTDIIVMSNTANIRVYLNNGTGAFTPLTAWGLTITERLDNFADINNDMRLDLITSSTTASFYRLGNADGTFGASVQLPAANYLYSREGDFDGDGDVDFAATNTSGEFDGLLIIYNQGNGSFTMSSPLIFLDSGNFFLQTVADFNNDGKPDILFVGDSITPKISVVLNQGNGNFTKTTYNVAPSVSTFSARLGDFNGDGFTDFINVAAPTGYVVSLNNGAGGFVQRSYPFGLNADRVIGDLNGDGKTDFIRISNTNRNGIAGGAGVFNETQFTVKTNVCNNVGQTKIIDFDRDGKTNRTLWRASDGRWRYEYNNFPNFPETAVRTFNWGANGDTTVPGDYDGDGATDYAVFRPSNAAWYIRNSSDNSFTSVAFGLGTDKPVPADYNGDGRTDIAVYRPSNGTWYILTSGSNQFSAVPFGISEDVPLPEDYDGDEKADIAVFRPSQGNWYIRRSSDGGFSAFTWGLSTDTPHPADYDGDGKADICVRRASTGYWYILRSYNNQFGAFFYGVASDIPQIGDWDGNGIMDIGVYRPDTRFWYSTGAFGGMFGEPGETPAASILR